MASATATNIAAGLNTAGGTRNGAAAATAAKLSLAPISITTGDGSPLSLDFALAEQQATGSLSLAVDGFATLSGAVTVEKRSRTLNLSSGSTTTANVLTIGGTGLSGFAGVNPGTANAMGLSLSNVGFAYVLATDELDPTRRWTTLQATAGTAALQGGNGLALTATNLGVSLNRGDANRVVVDYSANPLAVATGAGTTRTVTLDGALGEVTAAGGAVTLAAGDFFHASGTAALERYRVRWRSPMARRVRRRCSRYRWATCRRSPDCEARADQATRAVSTAA